MRSPPHRRLRNFRINHMNAVSCSPPHRRLRKCYSQNQEIEFCSPPHRRLRKLRKNRTSNRRCSPPHRRLRNANKQDAQGYGSALTYARRYSLMAACGIAPEDDDGNKAVESKHNKLSNNSNDKNAEFEKKLADWKANRFSPTHIKNLAKQHVSEPPVRR